MAEVIMAFYGFAVMGIMFFATAPSFAIAVVLLLRCVKRYTQKKALECPFLLYDDLAVVFLAIPFHFAGTILPYAQTKSVANLIEVVILSSVWSGFLVARGISSMFCNRNYVLYSRLSNLVFLVICALSGYFFPHLPE